MCCHSPCCSGPALAALLVIGGVLLLLSLGAAYKVIILMGELKRNQKTYTSLREL